VLLHLTFGIQSHCVRVACSFTHPLAHQPTSSDFKAKAEKRRGYNRHYALKGRGRKEHFRQSKRDDRAELAPTRAACMEGGS
jgi:hypothetical protein